MTTVTIILVLLVAVVISQAVMHILPVPIPSPLIQIVIGALLPAITGSVITLEPEIFFFLFLPPLLFLDGWRIPKEGLARDKWTILELALGLVVFTVIGVGFFIHWLIPAMPLAVAFALAAIMSPTDPVAVSAITKRIPMPKRLLHILEGEALLNDASGLVSMRVAVGAVVTGSFSLTAAFGNFLWTALAGLVIGTVVTFLITWILSLWSRYYEEEPGTQIVISLLIPFTAYLVAEHIEASGILAAVAAGVSMSYAEDALRNMATTRIYRAAVWDTLQFVTNGMVFVLLGEQLPHIIGDISQVTRQADFKASIWLILCIIAIYIALVGLRFVWVWFSLRFTLFRVYRRGIKPFIPDWRLLAVTSLAGVRGTVTLAGILTLPFVLSDHTKLFPMRETAIFIATGVILVSLISASITLPWLLKNIELPPEPSHRKEEERARAEAAEAAIKAVEQHVHTLSEGRSDADLYATAAARVMQTYRSRLTALSNTDTDTVISQNIDTIERQLRLIALQAEREIYRNRKKRHQLGEETANRFLREIDLAETRFTGA